MPYFSQQSKDIIATVHPDLQEVAYEVIKYIDCKATSGLRTLSEQQTLYAQGRTLPGRIVTSCDGVRNVSRHQSGNALDLIPYPIDWNNHKRFIFLGGFVLGTAEQMGIKLIWGGDFNFDYVLNTGGFIDMPHFERRVAG